VGAKLRERFVSRDEFFIFNREGEHGMFWGLRFWALLAKRGGEGRRQLRLLLGKHSA
jgi:hypothetical protein